MADGSSCPVSDYVRKGRLPSNWREHEVSKEGGLPLGGLLDGLMVIIRSGNMAPLATTGLLQWVKGALVSCGADVKYWPKNHGALLKTFGYQSFVNKRYRGEVVVYFGEVCLTVPLYFQGVNAVLLPVENMWGVDENAKWGVQSEGMFRMWSCCIRGEELGPWRRACPCSSVQRHGLLPVYAVRGFNAEAIILEVVRRNVAGGEGVSCKVQ
jgi:hypothetical protein